MRFTWDAKKSERNLAERGFDFDFASLIFDGPTVEAPDTREDYGEVRIIALGWPMVFRSPWSAPTEPRARVSCVASFRLE